MCVVYVIFSVKIQLFGDKFPYTTFFYYFCVRLAFVCESIAS